MAYWLFFVAATLVSLMKTLGLSRPFFSASSRFSGVALDGRSAVTPNSVARVSWPVTPRVNVVSTLLLVRSISSPLICARQQPGAGVDHIDEASLDAVLALVFDPNVRLAQLLAKHLGERRPGAGR